MAIYRIEWFWFEEWQFGSHTVELNIPPADVAAQTWLYGTTGSGSQYAGIAHFRRRLSNDQDEDVDFPDWRTWPPVIYEHLSSVTFGVFTGPGNEQVGAAVARMDYWG